MSPRRVTLMIDGLALGGGGALIVERALARLPGVLRVTVNPATEMAYVEYDPSGLTPERIGEAIAEAGYKTSLPARVLREIDS